MQMFSAIFAVIGIAIGIGIAVKNEFGVLGFIAAIVIGFLAGAYCGVAIVKFSMWKENRRLKRHE
jgi:hypothetical protein